MENPFSNQRWDEPPEETQTVYIPLKSAYAPMRGDHLYKMIILSGIDPLFNEEQFEFTKNLIDKQNVRHHASGQMYYIFDDLGYLLCSYKTKYALEILRYFANIFKPAQFPYNTVSYGLGETYFPFFEPLKLLIDDGFISFSSDSLLENSITQKSTDMLEFLFGYNLDPNIFFSGMRTHKRTLLMHAVCNIYKDADVSITLNTNDKVRIDETKKICTYSFISYLIDKRANINIIDEEGDTALHFAVAISNHPIG